MTSNSYIQVGATVIIANTGAAGTAGLIANGEPVTVYDLCGADVNSPSCYVKVKTKDGRLYNATIAGIAPTKEEDATQKFTTQLGAEEAAADLTRRKLAYLKAVNRTSFDLDHFKAWEAVRILKDAKADDAAKADQLASLIR